MTLPSPVRFNVEDVKRHADFLRIVSHYTRLRRIGRQYLGLCPFHSERHPSFYVEADRKLWNCFGCSLGGDVLSFVMRAEGCNFINALQFLASGHALLSNSSRASSRVP